MYEGNFPEAASWMEKALESSRASEGPADVRNRLTALLGIIAMRRGEIENCLECVGPSSCIFPISREAVHRNQAGSREAVRWFTAYLEMSPRDLRVIWLLNIAYMTLGEYPEKVPPDYRLPAELYRSEGDIGRFTNVASLAGLGARGPNLAGGSVFDDFNGDSLPDLFTTSLDADLGASLYINRGDGTFEDRSAWAGLGAQVYALNVTRADFDNDGDLDVLLLRGAWETPLRLSLLRNKGNGAFDDVTVASGLAEPIATESAAWGDYDNDGFVDVFVCGEYLPPGAPHLHSRATPAIVAGSITTRATARSRTWPPRPALSTSGAPRGRRGATTTVTAGSTFSCRTWASSAASTTIEGDGKFRDVAAQLGITGTDTSFACWFWDYDNDGLLDLYVNDYKARVAEVLCSAMGIKVEGTSRPRFYRNLGSAGFRDVSREVGLDRAMAPMGANFGDVDNDGFLDIYLGTGDMSYEGLEVNLMLRNVGGAHFEDITTSSGTGHLQKGHGVSFADWDCDGDLDLFVELGGATPGDQSYNALFQNPGQGHHWLKIKLVGTKTNRAALGAKIQVDLKAKDGQPRSIHRTVGNNSSFGGNSLVETIGLGETTRVTAVTISWPTSKTTQTFRDLAADQAIVITEGTDSFKVLRQPPLPTPSHRGIL